MTDTRNFANALENEGSAPVYLLDKKLDERTSQSAVETTDYVLLEDTDGAFHRIAKNSFNEAVRGALGSLLNNLDKGTNIKSVVGLGSASPVNDLGTVTLANLASLLGAFPTAPVSYKDSDGVVHFNNATESGIWNPYGAVQDSPYPNQIKAALLFVIKGLWITFQLLVYETEAFTRERFNESGSTWSAWTKI